MYWTSTYILELNVLFNGLRRFFRVTAEKVNLKISKPACCEVFCSKIRKIFSQNKGDLKYSKNDLTPAYFSTNSIGALVKKMRFQEIKHKRKSLLKRSCMLSIFIFNFHVSVSSLYCCCCITVCSFESYLKLWFQFEFNQTLIEHSCTV